jgi:hypothetical protein
MAITPTDRPIQSGELSTPSLPPVVAAALFTAANATISCGKVAHVSMTYSKQTKTKARIAGEDYVGMPGVSFETQIGTLSVYRRVDNKVNRRKGVAGLVYFKVKTTTRGDGVQPYGYANIRPEGITGFALFGLTDAPVRVPAEKQEA